jgi:hypothetical protein
MSNIGKIIKDFFCNGYCGRRYDLEWAVVEAEGNDWLVLRTTDGEPVYVEFVEYIRGEPEKKYASRIGRKQQFIEDYTIK